MRTKKAQYIFLPFEEGKVYQTRFATKERFLLQRIVKKGDRLLWFEGLYVGKEHIGTCPIGLDRLIPEQIWNGEIEVCSECGAPIEKDYTGDYIVQ